jgi:hypothetical protein
MAGCAGESAGGADLAHRMRTEDNATCGVEIAQLFITLRFVFSLLVLRFGQPWRRGAGY